MDVSSHARLPTVFEQQKALFRLSDELAPCVYYTLYSVCMLTIVSTVDICFPP